MRSRNEYTINKKGLRHDLAALTLCATLTLCVTALPNGTLTARASEENPQLTTEQTEGNTQLLARKDASYIVVIPKQAEITFDSTSSAIGSIVYKEGNLEPDAYVTVKLKEKTTLTHTVNDSYTIPYLICSEDKTVNFDSITYNENTSTGTETPLTAEITKEAWEAAKAGSYKATLTFGISYNNPHDGE